MKWLRGMGNWKAETTGVTQYCEVLILSGSLALFECFITFFLWEHNANQVWSFHYRGEGNSFLQQKLHCCKGKSKVIQRNNKMLKQACVLELKVGLRKAANDNWTRIFSCHLRFTDIKREASETGAWQWQKWVDCAKHTLTILAKMPCCLLKYNLMAVREQEAWSNAHRINSNWFFW